MSRMSVAKLASSKGKALSIVLLKWSQGCWTLLQVGKSKWIVDETKNIQLVATKKTHSMECDASNCAPMPGEAKCLDQSKNSLIADLKSETSL